MNKIDTDRNLEKYGLIDVKAQWNISPQKLQQITVEKGMGQETANGTLAVNTGKFTGRSPKDRFIVKDEYTQDAVWWGNINKPIEPSHFDALYNKVSSYISGKEVYVRDSYVCADPEYKLNVRTITEYPWSSMFVSNMFLRCSPEELEHFQEDWLVLCVPSYICPDPENNGI